MAKSNFLLNEVPGGPFSIEDVGLGSGSRFYVHHSGGSGGGYGYSPAQPLSTLAAAVAKCTANKGDKIYVLEGHNEGLSDDQWDLDVAGIEIIGLGKGSNRPRFDFDHANASINVKADGIQIRNIRLLPSVATVAIGIDIEAAVKDTLLEDIEVLPGEDGAGADEFVLGIDIKAGCSRTVIRRFKNRHHASCDGVNAGISLTGASDDVTIEDSDIVVKGTAGVAPIKGITTLSTNVRIRSNVLVSDNEPGIELLTGTTGVIADNSIFSDLGTIAAAIVADGCALFRNEYVEVGGERGALIGTASVDD